MSIEYLNLRMSYTIEWILVHQRDLDEFCEDFTNLYNEKHYEKSSKQIEQEELRMIAFGSVKLTFTLFIHLFISKMFQRFAPDEGSSSTNEFSLQVHCRAKSGHNDKEVRQQPSRYFPRKIFTVDISSPDLPSEIALALESYKSSISTD